MGWGCYVGPEGLRSSTEAGPQSSQGTLPPHPGLEGHEPDPGQLQVRIVSTATKLFLKQSSCYCPLIATSISISMQPSCSAVLCCAVSVLWYAVLCYGLL